MSPKHKREFIYLILSGIFITNALLGELLGGKLLRIGPATFSLGVISWPVVFIITDLINEYFGKDGVRRLTLFTVALIFYAFIIVFVGMQLPATEFSPVTDQNFNNVFGQSLWIIVGSIVAFLLSQLIDVLVFWMVHSRTGGRLLWLRATGSTAISQLIDTFVVLGIAFYLPGVLGLLQDGQTAMTFDQYLETSASNYSYKLVIAVLLTPLIYAGHGAIDKILGHEADHLMNEAARSSLSQNRHH
jgi:uncharacterized integral membrane protein (TIGR00697 family)